MAHFAQLNENNVVIQVIVVNNEVLLDQNGVEQEQIGIDFCKSLFGEETIWKQTSYNSTFRKNFAGIGYEYSVLFDGFISPKPFDSWSLNENTCQWEAPINMPNDGNSYYWSEESHQWLTTD